MSYEYREVEPDIKYLQQSEPAPEANQIWLEPYTESGGAIGSDTYETNAYVSDGNAWFSFSNAVGLVVAAYGVDRVTAGSPTSGTNKEIIYDKNNSHVKIYTSETNQFHIV